jgi:hypothetical protein
MEEKKAWYLDERAQQLAIVYLSRRSDLAITRRQNSDYGLDFLVSLVKNGEYTGRVFGVEVKARKSLQRIRQASRDTDEIRLDIDSLPAYQDFPFPLCLFVFTMENDEGYYRWIKKPVYDVERESRLLFNESNTFKKLTNKAIGDIVTEVDNWYESKLKLAA